jgi:hypothetical protein
MCLDAVIPKADVRLGRVMKTGAVGETTLLVEVLDRDPSAEDGVHAFISVGLDLGEDAQPAWEAVKLGQILSRNAPVSINTTQMSAPDFGGVIDEHRPLPGAEGEG